MDTATAVGLGTGSLKDAGAVTRDLMELPRGGARSRSSGLNAGALALMGIKLESANG